MRTATPMTVTKTAALYWSPFGRFLTESHKWGTYSYLLFTADLIVVFNSRNLYDSIPFWQVSLRSRVGGTFHRSSNRRRSAFVSYFRFVLFMVGIYIQCALFWYLEQLWGPLLTLLGPFYILGTIACLYQLRTAAIHPVITNSLLSFLFQLETSLHFISFVASFVSKGLILTPLWRYSDSCHSVGRCHFSVRNFTLLLFIYFTIGKCLWGALFWHLTCLQGPFWGHSVTVYRILATCFGAGN
jgi:hypothetical protein